MKVLLIYVDTSVIGGCCDPEFAEDSLRLMNAFRRGQFRLLFSIVSWNFRHIVQLHKIKAYNQVNLAQGYGYITIPFTKGGRHR